MMILNSCTKSWRWASLRSVSLKTSLIDPTKNPSALFQYVDVSSVSNDLWQIVDSSTIFGGKAPSRARKLIQANDVIFATVRPTLKRVALVPVQLSDQVASTAFCVIRANPEKADHRFVFYSLLTDEFAKKMESIEHGASYPAVTDNNVLDQEILFPPLPEQKAIAVILSKIQAAIEIQDKTISTLKELKTATMTKLFREGISGPSIPLRETLFGDVPASWEILSLADCAYVQTGLAKGKKNGGQTTTNPYLRVANVQDGFLDLTEIKQITVGINEIKRFLLQDGDVLLTEGGDFDKLGRGFIWRNQIPGCIHQNHVFAVRTNRKLILPEFLTYLAQSPYGKGYFLKVAHKTTNLACINSQKLKEFPVLIPTILEQQKIAEILQKIDEKLTFSKNKLISFKSVFSSLLHQLMTGELGVNEALEYLNKEVSDV